MADDGKQEVIYSKDILSMVSPEGEKVRFESVKTLSHHALCIVLSVVLLCRLCWEWVRRKDVLLCAGPHCVNYNNNPACSALNTSLLLWMQLLKSYKIYHKQQLWQKKMLFFFCYKNIWIAYYSFGNYAEFFCRVHRLLKTSNSVLLWPHSQSVADNSSLMWIWQHYLVVNYKVGV